MEGREGEVEARRSHVSKKYCVNWDSERAALLILMRSRTERRWGEVKRPILRRGAEGWEGEGRYWDRIEETKAEVEPLPFVPATWMMLRRSKSDGWGWMRGRKKVVVEVVCSHLVADSTGVV